MLLTGSLFCAASIAAPGAKAKPPNIVLILSDDQSYTDYSFMGHPHIETPHLDKLASESALFRRGYVPTALCRPALMTLATGLYSYQNKTTGNNPARTAANTAHAKEDGNDILELLISHIDETGSIAQWLGEKGYVSHQSGKWWEGSFQRGGFTEGMTKGYPNPGGRHGDAGLKIGREGMEPVIDFIDRSVADEKPFFVWYAPFLPHTPHNPPKRLLDKYLAKGVPERIAKYYAMCEWLDETCGELVGHIDDTGIGEDTLIIYVTDNGWIQTERGSYAERSKRSPNEGGTRNPIMFRWPGTIPAADRPELCTSLDIVPTILAAAGAEEPHDFPGLDLLPELKSGDAIGRDTLYGESFAHDIADIENPQASLLYRWVIKGHDKLLLTYDGAPGKMKYPPQGGEAQLYDLKKDPGETNNLATEHPVKVEELSALLDKWYVADQRQVGKVSEGSAGAEKKKPRRKEMEQKAAAKKQAATSNKDDSRPNILLLYADDQRNHTLGCAGHPIVKTPNIDRLAGEGVRFENAFVSTSTCWVGRSSLFTSTYERKHLYKVTPGPLNPTLCESSYFAVLKEAGYRTGHLGKEHVNIADASASLMWDVREKIGRRPYFKKMKDGSDRHETQILGDWGIDFLKEQPKDQPFCLQISFNATHAEDGDKRPGIGHFPWPKVTNGMYEDQEMPLPPLNDPAIYDAQPDFLKKSINRQRFFWRWDTPEKYQTNMQAYFRMLSGIDHVVGRLVEQLEEQGLADNTIIVYTADNGYYLGDRGFAGKWTHYEESLRVPLVVYDPRQPKEEQGLVLPEIALNSDIGSTLIDLAGLPTPEAHTGRSLAPLLRGDEVSDWRKDFLCEFLAVPGSIPRWEGVRGERMTYARYFVDGTDKPPFEFLFDLKTDPDQLINLALAEEEHPYLENMRRRTDALVTEAGPPMRDVGAVQRSSKQKAKSAPAPASPKTKPAKSAQNPEEQPDVVFIIVDDLNDWIGAMGGHPQSQTPNMDALAGKGVLFTNAHCNAPQCGPSRTSLLHGLYPKSTGKYFNSTRRPDFFGDQPMQGVTSKNAPKDSPIFHRHFKQHGYRVVSGGKVAHGSTVKQKGDVDAYLNRPGDVRGNATDDKANLWGEAGPHNHPDEETGDYKVAQWAIDEWQTVTDEPLLMSVGFYRPHRPFNAPKAYFEKFPLESIQLPKVQADDLDDLPPYGRALARSNAHKDLFKPRTVHEQILHLGGEQEWKYMVQSYLACINYVDTQIGLLLKALKENPRGRETVIVFTSDHGWNLGEKTHWCKAAIWRDTTRVPFMVVLPGVTEAGARNNQPISHVDIYPSFCDFAGIPKPSHLEGQSILPLLSDSSAKRDVAFLSYGPENTAAQSERYRYLRYEDGSEELYDHQNDPNEWTNLSSQPEYGQIESKMREQVLSFQNR